MTDPRTRWPEIAALVDGLREAGFSPRVTCITDHDGNVLAGKLLTPDPRTFEVSVETVDRLREHQRHVDKVAGKPWPKVQR